MKNLILLTLIAISFTNCMGCARVSPGYVGIKSTVVGSDRGLSDAAVGPAWVFYNPFTESIFEYPTSVKTAIWTHSENEGSKNNDEITFTNKDRMQIAADISLAYQIAPEKAAAFYLKFRSDDLYQFSEGIMRNWAREKFDTVAGKYDINQIMGDNATFLQEVRESLQKELEPLGVTLVQFGFIGAPRPPKSVQDSINLAVQATQIAQQKQNELIQAQADAAKQVATAEGDGKSILARAEAQAKANKLLSESLTENLIKNKMLDKWDGILPKVQSGSSLIQIPSN